MVDDHPRDDGRAAVVGLELGAEVRPGRRRLPVAGAARDGKSARLELLGEDLLDLLRAEIPLRLRLQVELVRGGLGQGRPLRRREHRPLGGAVDGALRRRVERRGQVRLLLLPLPVLPVADDARSVHAQRFRLDLEV